MDNKISEIRKKIRALRLSMLEAEAVMRDQISRGDDCSDVAGKILAMRAEMVRLVRERTILGDREPISVSFAPRRPEPVTAVVRAAKRRLKRVG
jgi:hypothetical protein